jgi:hypothetical protein
MRKFILNAVIFLLFIGLFYIFAVVVWAQYAPARFKPNIDYRLGSIGHMHSRLSEVKNQKDIDILFLGSSHTYRGFDTRIFKANGYRTFNLGSSAQTPLQTTVLLNRYLEKINPKTIIYEVYPNTFMLDGVESSLDIISNDSNDLYSLEMAFKINNIKTYNTFLYGLARDVLNLNTSFSESVVKGNDTYIQGGFVENKIGYFEPVIFEKKSISIKKNQLASFSQIVSRLKRSNINLILVYAPIPSSNYKSYSNNRYFDSIMESYSEYYNFNKIIKLDDSLHFYDSHHLNQNGVELFNTKLIEILDKKIKN